MVLNSVSQWRCWTSTRLTGVCIVTVRSKTWLLKPSHTDKLQAVPQAFQNSLVFSEPFPRVQLFSASSSVLLWFCQCIVWLCKAKTLYKKCMEHSIWTKAPPSLLVCSCSRLHVCPGNASISLLDQCVFCEELQETAPCSVRTRTICYTRNLTKASLCLQAKWRSGNISMISVIRRKGWVPEEGSVTAIGQIWVDVSIMQCCVVTSD